MFIIIKSLRHLIPCIFIYKLNEGKEIAPNFPFTVCNQEFVVVKRPFIEKICICRLLSVN